MPVDSILIGDHQYPVEIIIESRKNARVTLGKKAVLIRIPRYLSFLERKKHIDELKQWAFQRLQQQAQQGSLVKEYVHEQLFHVQDKTYLLSIYRLGCSAPSVRLKETSLLFRIPHSYSDDQKNQAVGRLLSRILAKQSYQAIYQRLMELNALHFQESVAAVRLKNVSSLWGSCSSKRIINLSTRLLFVPKEVLDYVMIHELAHLKQHNHSYKFWALVSQAMPSYKEQIHWLRSHARVQFF